MLDMLENYFGSDIFFNKGVIGFMKSLKVLLFSVGAVVVMFGAVSESKAQTGEIRKVLNRMDAAYKSLSSLRANVQMEKRDSVLGETDTYVGKVIYVPK